mmetsp:Transcript_84842/g.137590  ORF Transcript_84842/g.137590 Transcript_84842/m.137590 type:complete len:85 (+) Transcript_84842:762-1016(+)
MAAKMRTLFCNGWMFLRWILNSSGCSVQRCMNLRVSVAPFSTGVDETRERMEDEDIADAEKGLCVFCEGEGVCVCFLGCAYVCV